MSKIFLALLLSAAVIAPRKTVQAQVEGEPGRASKGAGPATNAPTRSASVLTRSVSVPDSSRGYDAQALRFETTWGNVRIIRGANNSVVGTAGWFRDPGLEKLLA